MKRMLLTTVYLTVMSSLLLAQAPIRPVGESDALTPLTNLPSFPGGHPALETYLNGLDLYPPGALNAHLEGTVLVQFRVLSNGQLTRVQVVQSRGALLDQAAIRAVSMMPRWYPAHRDGVTIPYSVKLPITFRLN